MSESLSKSERLKKKADFARVFEQPDVKASCSGAKLVAKRNGFERNRFAVTFVRKFGTSVLRNYSRRVLKEIYRRRKWDIPAGYDIVVVLFPGNFSYHDREQQFMKLLQRVEFV